MSGKIQMIRDYRAHTDCSLSEAVKAINGFIMQARELPTTPQIWEYRIQVYNTSTPPFVELGQAGWELAAVAGETFYFKRRPV